MLNLSIAGNTSPHFSPVAKLDFKSPDLGAVPLDNDDDDDMMGVADDFSPDMPAVPDMDMPDAMVFETPEQGRLGSRRYVVLLMRNMTMRDNDNDNADNADNGLLVLLSPSSMARTPPTP